jgi:oligopeptide/dipeptide ABC transporter ATP-binding protein
MTVLRVRDLRTSFFTRTGELPALSGVSFEIAERETLALVGESGCGKSLTALSIMRLLAPPGRVVGGQVELDGRDLLTLTPREMEKVRGDRLSMIFQEPMTSLNPVLTIGEQIAEALILHRGINRASARRRSVELLDLVRIADPQRRVDEYPHRLSGGQRQRVMIAMAVALEPRLLIADEPTTALDVTIQAQIIELLRTMQQTLGMALLLITHDLGVVARMADRVLVMYAGRVIEEASAVQLYRQPRHPYTKGLFAAVPTRGNAKRRLKEIPGMVPPLSALPSGCTFCPRCSCAESICNEVVPRLLKDTDGRVACHVAMRRVAAE